MNVPANLNRRHFIRSGLLGAAAAAATALPQPTAAALTKAQREPADGLKLGVASYTLREFSLDDAIAMTKEAGVRYICLKDVHLPLKSTPEKRQEARSKIQAAGLVLMGGGVIYMKNDDQQIRDIFDYAKEAGMPTIVCSPDPDALDTVEKYAKQYDRLIAIHNHGPTDKKYPSPLDVLKLIKDRDSRMGICIDVGHTVRIGQDPVPIIGQCASRLYDFHMKDVTEPTSKGKPIAVGRGIIDIPGVLRALLSAKYPHHVALEYEDKPRTPMPGMCESFGYLKGVLALL